MLKLKANSFSNAPAINQVPFLKKCNETEFFIECIA